MGRKKSISRRRFLPILGSSMLLPLVGNSTPLETEEDLHDDFEILLKPDGTTVKVKKTALKNSEIVSKKISNSKLLRWLGKKG